MPTDPCVQEMDPMLTFWFASWLRRVEEEEHNWLEDVLGTRWHKDWFKHREGPQTRPDATRIPLTLALAQFDFLKEIKKQLNITTADMPGGVPEDLQGTEIEEMGNWAKNAFLAMIGGAGLLPEHLDPSRKKPDPTKPRPKKS